MIYDELGVKSYINALDPVAAYGGNLLSPTVLDAMEEATRSFVRMDELHRAVGERIAEMTHNEGAAVVSGTAAGVAAGALLAPQPHSSSAKVSVRAITLFIIFFLSRW